MSKVYPNQPTLVLGASPRVSLPIARSLHRHGISVDIASFQPEEPNLRSRAVREFHRLPDWRKDRAAFSEALLVLVKAKGFDLVLPAGDPSLAALAHSYEKLTPLLTVGCPRPEIAERVLDKSLTLEIAQRCEIRIPFTCTVHSSGELESVAAVMPFPVVAKPAIKGAAPFRALYAKSFPELHALLKRIQWNSVLLQEYCAGVGVGLEILMHKGQCIAHFQHQRLKEAPFTGGVSILAIAEEPDPELFKASLELLRALQWDGPAMVEFRVDRENHTFVLMEVNGRFWGSVSFPIAAGIDFPLYHWQLRHGESPTVPRSYRVGSKWRWSPGYVDRMQSIVFRAPGGLGPKPSVSVEVLSAIGDFSTSATEAVWSWADPMPFFAELFRMAWGFQSAVSKSAFRRLVPRKLRSYLGTYSRLEPRARAKYAEFCMKDVFGMYAQNARAAGHHLENVRSVLFVCYGNLMRSPMAEAMLKHVLVQHGNKEIIARSAGIHALKGREAHPWALAVSCELGIPLDGHRAQPTTPELIAASDLIFAMDYENLAELETKYPEARGRTFLLSAYAEGPRHNREILDPYFGDINTTRQCYAELWTCIEKLARQLSSEPRNQTSPGHVETTGIRR